MYKHVVLSFFKIVLMFVTIFLVFFISILSVKLLPVSYALIDAKNIIKISWSIIKPSFFHSFFNSLIVSLFIFDLIIYNKLTKYRAIVFAIPLLLSTILVFLVIYFLKPDVKKLSFYKSDDARLYFVKKSFFEYSNKIIFFTEVSKDKANDIIILDDKNLSLVKEGKFEFLEDQIRLQYLTEGKKEEIVFDRQELREYKESFKLNRSRILRYIETISYKFIYSDNIYINLFLWFSVAFFILSFTILIKFKKFPFLTFTYNILFLILFYYGFDFLFDLYNRIFLNFLSKSLIRDIFLSLFILFCSLILQSIRIVFFKIHKEGEYS